MVMIKEVVKIIYYTGDLHGDINRVVSWINSTSFAEQNNYLIQLGDAGLNYYLDERDKEKKDKLSAAISSLNKKNATLKVLFVRGNHDCRPERIESYRLHPIFGAHAYIEAQYPELVFLKDSSIYSIEERRFFVLGGGYSRDFFDRILRGDGFWFDEQMNDEEFAIALEAGKRIEDEVIVLSHSLPLSISPNGYGTYSTESRTECHLDIIYHAIEQRLVKWLAGHYHTDWMSADKKFETIYKSIKGL